MKLTKRQIQQALCTARDWHEGNWVYSFVSTRRIADEEHRKNQIASVQHSIALENATVKPRKRELARLNNLLLVLQHAPVGVELLDKLPD